MEVSNLVIGLVAVALTGLGLAFSVWARKVDEAKESLDRMSKSIREIVELRLQAMGDDVHQIRGDLKEMLTLVHHHDKTIAVHNEKLELAFHKEKNNDR